MSLDALVYSTSGKSSGTVSLPAQVFGASWNADLVHQVVVSLQARRRQGSAHTKDRGDVSGGGRKPWRQKGTGRARHGSTRSPIWRGGGTTHGPRNEKDYSQKVNDKMRRQALASLLSRKYRDQQVFFVEALSFAAPKSRDAQTLLKTLSGNVPQAGAMLRKRRNSLLIALPGHDANAYKSFRNFGNVAITDARDLNALDVATNRLVMVVDPAKALELIPRNAAKTAGKVSATKTA